MPKPVTITSIHKAARMRAQDLETRLAIDAASNINRLGRLGSRNKLARHIADPRLVRLARQLAAATKAGF
jgi:hypothetical protein